MLTYFAVSIPVMIIITLLHVVGVIFLLHGKHRKIPVYQITANAVIANLLIDLVNFPGNVYKDLGYKMSKAYCWIYSHFQLMDFHLIPFMLLMFSIERLMYIRDPTRHAQKLTQGGVITLLLVPWVTSIAFTLLENAIGNPDVLTSLTFGNDTYNWCTIQGQYNVVVRKLVRGMIEVTIVVVACVVISITVLVMWCCFKQRLSRGMDYNMLGADVAKNVRQSVIAVSILNFLYFVILMFRMSVHESLGLSIQFLVDLYMSVFGVIEVVVWVCCLEESRKQLLCLCCRRYRRENEMSGSLSVRHDTNNTEGVEIQAK